MSNTHFRCHRVYMSQQRGFRFFCDYWNGQNMYSGVAMTQAEAEQEAGMYAWTHKR
jgi:hypothetical protein